MSQPHTLKNWKTLLIGSDPLIADSLCLAFKVCGAHLVTAPTVETGLAILKKTHFDIHICDLRFPKIDCLDFFRRAPSRHKKTLNVVLSSSWNEYLIKEALASGVHHFIQKPFSVETLLQSLPLWAEARRKGYHRTKPWQYHPHVTDLNHMAKTTETSSEDFAQAEKEVVPTGRKQSPLWRRYMLI